MSKIHLTRPSYEGNAACMWISNKPLVSHLQITNKISEATCKRCLSLISPVRTVDELIKLALRSN